MTLEINCDPTTHYSEGSKTPQTPYSGLKMKYTTPQQTFIVTTFGMSNLIDEFSQLMSLEIDFVETVNCLRGNPRIFCED